MTVPVLPHLVATRAATSPETPFLVEAIGGATASYGEVWDRVLRAAAELSDAGIAAGDAAAVLLETSIDGIVTWLALGALGAVEVPLNLAYRGPQLREIVEDAEVTALIGRPEHLRTVLGGGASAPPARPIVAVPVDPATGIGTSSGPRCNPAAFPDAGAHTTACVLHTSGTTGRSKGVVVRWGQLAATAAGLLAEPPDAGAVGYVPAPLFHVGGKAPVHLLATVGGTAVLRPAFKTGRFWPEVVEHDCSVTFLGAAMANFLLEDEANAPKRGEHPLQDVLMAPVIARLEQFVERFGVRVSSAFNMTELSCPITTGWIERHDGTCGRARPGYECRIVDEHDHEVADGVAGELVVRADRPWVLAAGYWRRPDATAEAWRNLWFHTGDVLRRTGADFTFVDRLKDAVRRRGENISSIELEALLLQHDEVVEAAVVGTPSEHGEEEVLAFVRIAAGSAVTESELHEAWSQVLPAFMVPRYVEIVADMPRTANEKVRKSELRTRGVGPRTWEARSRR